MQALIVVMRWLSSSALLAKKSFAARPLSES
jgi:hypothetical protein